MKGIFPYLIVIILTACGCSKSPDPVVPGNVIILMYHRLTDGEATNIYERSAADFEKDLSWLHDHHIKVIDFDQLGRIVSGEEKLTTDAAIITFDDGDHSWYTIAVPLLKKYRMKATFFLWASMMDANSFLTWDEVTLMSSICDQNGERPFDFGSHTLYHKYLQERKASFSTPDDYNVYLDEELGGSKRLIDDHIYGSVVALSLPFGDGAGDADIIAGAIRNGYSYIRTSEWSALITSGADLYQLPAVPVMAETDPEIIGEYLRDLK